jgi:hypothetical protein
MGLYKIIYKDGSEFEGGDSYLETKWASSPKDKEIKGLLYGLITGDMLTLVDYDKYYQYIEGTRNFDGKSFGKVNFEYAVILGKKGDKAIRYKINLTTNIIEMSEFNISDNEISKLNPEFWR